MTYATFQAANSEAEFRNMGSDSVTWQAVAVPGGYDIQIIRPAAPTKRKPSGTPKDKAQAAITKKHGAAGWQKFTALHGEKDAYAWHLVAYFKG